jgi:hypothetical protein
MQFLNPGSNRRQPPAGGIGDLQERVINAEPAQKADVFIDARRTEPVTIQLPDSTAR